MIRQSGGGKNTASCNSAELFKLLAYFSVTQPALRPLVLLHYGGFKIAGLRGEKHATLRSLGHRLLWNESISFGMCTCQQWKGDDHWTYDMTSIQHGIHARQVKPAAPRSPATPVRTVTSDCQAEAGVSTADRS